MRAILGVVAAVGLFSTAASAYPTMIRHGYTQCATCHIDPSGGTLLTEYGRAQSALLLSSRWGAAKDAEPAATSKFLLGLVDTPDSLALGGWVRQGYIWNTVDGKLVDHRELQMRSSLAAAVRLGPLRAAAELGYASAHTAQLAEVSRNQDGANLVSREHWIGLAFADGTGLVRGGRINVPFGLRNPEHTSFVRAATRTDINENQQDGIAIAFTKEKWRAEVMAVLGNYSLRPDAFNSSPPSSARAPQRPVWRDGCRPISSCCKACTSSRLSSASLLPPAVLLSWAGGAEWPGLSSRIWTSAPM